MRGRPGARDLALGQAPELLGPEPRERMLDTDGSPQPGHVRGSIGRFDAAPAASGVGRLIAHSRSPDRGASAACVRTDPQFRVPAWRIYTTEISQCEFHMMMIFVNFTKGRRAWRD